MAALGFGILSFDLDGTRQSLDIATVKASEWKIVKAFCGRRPFEVLTEIDDPECLESIYWLVNKRAGRDFAIGSEDFDAIAFLASVEHADNGAEAPKGEARPSGARKKPSKSV